MCSCMHTRHARLLGSTFETVEFGVRLEKSFIAGHVGDASWSLVAVQLRQIPQVIPHITDQIKESRRKDS